MAQELYHASPQKELAVITPQKTLSNDIYIGDFIFATRDKTLAIMYLANKGVATLMEHRTKKPYIVIQDEVDRYMQNDRGGVIYTVSAKDFRETPQSGLEGTEFVTEQPQKPLGKHEYATSLDAMKQAGITIYFVDSDTFERLLDKNNKQKVLASLIPVFSRD